MLTGILSFDEFDEIYCNKSNHFQMSVIFLRTFRFHNFVIAYFFAESQPKSENAPSQVLRLVLLSGKYFHAITFMKYAICLFVCNSINHILYRSANGSFTKSSLLSALLQPFATNFNKISKNVKVSPNPVNQPFSHSYSSSVNLSLPNLISYSCHPTKKSPIYYQNHLTCLVILTLISLLFSKILQLRHLTRFFQFSILPFSPAPFLFK